MLDKGQANSEEKHILSWDSIQLIKKDSGYEPQEACRRDELIDGKPPVIK
jgi:hypothetical protein